MALTDRDRRALIILGAVAGVALVAFVLLKLLGGGGGQAAAPLPPTIGAPTTSPTPSVTPTPRETLPPVVLAGARDPFSIPPELSPTPSGGVGPSAPPGGTTTTPPTTPPTTVPPPPPTTVPPPPTAPPPTGPPTMPPAPPGDTTVVGGHTVTLQFVNAKAEKVKVKVDRQVWIVERGARFDDNFKLVAIDGRCARFLFGDEAFELCLGGSG